MELCSGNSHVSEQEGQGTASNQCYNRLPAHYGVVGPNASPDETAAYYMYQYKILLCTKDHSHDWGACPYAHEKENARRRDPSKHKYSSCICPNAKKPEGCPNGITCQYAHTLFEYWLHPQRFRTQMCRSGASCQRSLCFFAHSAEELRTPGSTHEYQVLLQRTAATMPPPGPTALAAVPEVSSLRGLPPQANLHVSSDMAQAAAAAAWPLGVDESSSSFSSQASRIVMGPGVASAAGSRSASETDMSILQGLSSPLVILPAQGQQQLLASPAALLQLQQQQELQRRQARYMELQLQLQLKQQQDNARAAFLQLELQKQQAVAAAAAGTYPALGEVSAAGFSGLNPAVDIAISSGLGPLGCDSLSQGLVSSALAAAVISSGGQTLLPSGQLLTTNMRDALPSIAPAAIRGLPTMSLPEVAFMSGPSGLSSSNNVLVSSESLLGNRLDLAQGKHVQSWM